MSFKCRSDVVIRHTHERQITHRGLYHDMRTADVGGAALEIHFCLSEMFCYQSRAAFPAFDLTGIHRQYDVSPPIRPRGELVHEQDFRGLSRPVHDGHHSFSTRGCLHVDHLIYKRSERDDADTTADEQCILVTVDGERLAVGATDPYAAVRLKTVQGRRDMS